MLPQAKLEHIIYLVREYEQDLKDQHELCNNIIQNGIISSTCLGSPIDFEYPTIEPKAELYLERIEAFLESTK